MKHLNMNRYVSFALSTEGYQYLLSRGEKLSPQRDGKYRLQVWQFIDIFGDAYKPWLLSPTINNEILIEEKDLTDEKT